MYVCSCFAVTDRQLRETARAGVKTWKTVTRRLKVSTQCGICAQHAKAIFDKERSEMQQESRSDKTAAA